MTTNNVKVWLWGRHIASLAADANQRISFRYVDDFTSSLVQVSPLLMPLDNRTFSGFEQRNEATFKGLPPLVIDSLPDKFGEALIRQWLARQGRNDRLTPARTTLLHRKPRHGGVGVHSGNRTPRRCR